MKIVVRTPSTKSTIPDFTVKEDDEVVADATCMPIPFNEISERLHHGKQDAPRCTLLDANTVGEVVRGLVFASLAITDDKYETLRNTCKDTPWHLKTVKAITGSREKAHQPLSRILKDMNLQIDEHIDVATGITRSGQSSDVKGYIAHNDEIIVLAYRCSTSPFDWLTSVPMASSAWEVDKDIAFSGLSGMECFCCSNDELKPCVNSAFYRVFLASLPVVKRNIEPLLAPDQPPRKLFVTGHSLGAGVATLAACYFMLQFDWTILPHSLIMVTAGSPRSCCRSMKEVIDERRLKMGSSVRLYRVVNGHDIVVAFPPSTSGFAHIVPRILIDEQGTICQEEEALFDDEQEAASVLEDTERMTFLNEPSRIPVTGSSKYDRFLAKMHKGLRDHLPDAYLMSFFQASGIRCGTQLEQQEDNVPIVRNQQPYTNRPSRRRSIEQTNPRSNAKTTLRSRTRHRNPDPVLCPSFGPNMRLSQARSSMLLENNKYQISSLQSKGIRCSADGSMKEDRPHLDPVLCPSFGPDMRLNEACSTILLDQSKRNSFVRRRSIRRKVGPV